MSADAANVPLPENGGKEKQRMARITAKTHDTLLPIAAALYPRHPTAELIEKGLETLIGNPQPIVYFCGQDPEIQIQTAATFARHEQRLENNTRAITRARFDDPKDQQTAREAAKGLLILKDDIRKSIKAIAEDASQFRTLVATVSPLLLIAKTAIKRWLDCAEHMKKKGAAFRSKGEQAKADAEDKLAQKIFKETSALREIIRLLTPTDGPPSTPA